MKVKLKTMRVAAVNGETVVQQVDDIVELDSAEAKALLEKGYAEPVARTKAAKAETR